MDWGDWLIGIALVLIAGVTRGLSGFGSAMILSPGLSLLFNPQQVVVTVILLEITASFSLIPEAFSKTKWREILPIALTAILMIPIGTYFLILLDPILMRRIIGGLLLVFVLFLLVGKHFHLQKRISIGLGVGALSGFLTGLTGMGGPPVVLYELSRDNKAAANRANLISFFALTQFFALLSYWLKGILSVSVFQQFLFFLPAFLLGLVFGRSLFTWVSEILFRKLVLGVLLVIGLFAISI